MLIIYGIVVHLVLVRSGMRKWQAAVQSVHLLTNKVTKHISCVL